MFSDKSERHLWECSECGTIYQEPKRDCRHAEGKAGIGVYYPVRRLTVRVVEVADVAYVDHQWVYTPASSEDES